MTQFNATVETQTSTYYIDQKPSVNGVKWFVVLYRCPLTLKSSAVWFNSVPECLEWIEEHSEYVAEQAV